MSLATPREARRHGFEKKAEVARAWIDRGNRRRFAQDRIVAKELLRDGLGRGEDHRERDTAECAFDQKSLRDTSLTLQIHRKPSWLLAMLNRRTIAFWMRARKPMPPL